MDPGRRSSGRGQHRRGRGARCAAAPLVAEDCLEALCHDTGLPRFVLDLRRASTNPAASRYFSTPHAMRSIGAVATRTQFYPTAITHDFDAIVFVDHTSATQLMHPPK